MATLPFLCASLPLTADDLAAALDAVHADAAAVWAILTVESGKAGFLADRRPQILFERAKFHARTGGRYDSMHPGISAPSWGGYSGGAAEYARLGQAYALDADAALESTSWGLAQIMGFNCGLAGYGSITDFVQDACASEGAQLRAFLNFLKRSGIDRELARHDWTAVARKYNGPAQVELYAGRLQAAHVHLSAPGGLPDLNTRAAQLLLTFLSTQFANPAFLPGSIDGQPGSRTLKALNAFLVTQGAAAQTQIDAATVERLQVALVAGENLRLE